MMTEKERIKALLNRSKGDPARFHDVFLGGTLWERQKEICRSVAKYPITLVPTGNMVGKTRVSAANLHAFLFTHPNCLVVATAPTQVQLEEVLWKEVEKLHRGARIPLGGRLLKSPLKVEIGNGWQALAYSTTKVERFSGHHAQDLLAIGDEASGISDEIKEAISSLGATRELWPGNPLRPSGWFYESCLRAENNPHANLIQISSLESPHIDMVKSLWGLADKTWLETNRNDYGENSLWWMSHVLGLFPDAGEDTVIPRDWIDLASQTIHVRKGEARTAVDLSLGGGGDRSVVMTGDDNGIIALDWSRTWSLEDTAAVVARHARMYYVDDHRISFDVEGIGADFAARLSAVGIRAAQPYRGGGATKGNKYANFRAKAAWHLRQRLDPQRMVESGRGVMVPQHPYAIRPEWVALMRVELQALTYSLGPHGEITLIKSEDLEKKLRHSPDFQATICQLHAWGD